MERRSIEGRYQIKVSMTKLSAGMNLNKCLKLSLIAEMGGLSRSRIAYYIIRALKAFLEDIPGDTDPYFKSAVYASIGMRYKF